ncbi:uncharacterized protein LOC129318107 isoform X2 [Prosopis cineraria]|uniref:uncharacterized protein LOC129318107 isoform X2 n=1 Tax=Prosopis cineraria TaxID=364024 RepID=UPI00240F8453|nr:uncharacterized protein LOC129318107 isoform X2 [Prosopis cineraria]
MRACVPVCVCLSKKKIIIILRKWQLLVPSRCFHYGNWHETQARLCPSLQQVKCPNLSTDMGEAEIACVTIDSLPQCSIFCDVPASMKIEDPESFLNSDENGRKESCQSNLVTLKVKRLIRDDNDDDLDHVVLKERQRMLLGRRRMAARPNHLLEDVGAELLEDFLEHANRRVNEWIHSVDDKIVAASNQCNDILGGNASSLKSPSRTTAESIISINLQGRDHVFKSAEMAMQSNLYEENGVLPAMNDGQNSSTFLTFIKVKDEPCDGSEFHNLPADGLGNFSFNFMNVKSEQEVLNKYDNDLVEHVCLRDRLKFVISGDSFSANSSTSYTSLKDTGPSTLERSSSLESPESLSIKLPRKRKITATDSVQTALEEDAPGLLQVLIDKGVLVDEIKLYGGVESGEALDESYCEDSFAKFEVVMSKTRYLQFRKWPVEWGWCRDLQSFIFVFERHNRVVLERPEYGFATYFFELVESLPIAWQIKRLVTAMKLTCCGRISLIENKALRVGEDLTEGEAQVLMEFGWIPNSGLGTMLNYCDRVVHDRKNERESSEWRSKIGRLLMDGYNGGTIVAPSIPKRAS